jgi:nucleotide-binding universal stress UspA family protein
MRSFASGASGGEARKVKHRKKEDLMKTIAWATDGSPAARNALTTAKHLAHLAGARLLVLHVQELGITRTGFLTDRNDKVVVALHHLVEQLRDEGIDAVLATGEAPAGGADKSIVQLAQKADVDLLVIGNRGHGPLAGMFLGSVALRLIRNAPFPVLMVPSRGRMARKKADLEQYRAAPALVPTASPV